MSVDHHVGDCRLILPTLAPGSINLACTSPPFLGLRDYVGGDNEIGTEPTPADFLQSLLEVTALIGDVLTADGSIAVELGDTYASTGSSESATTRNRAQPRRPGGDRSVGGHHLGGEGWPLDKSMCMIPHSYALSLAYGRNILSGEASPAGVWRVRNVICWVRNPAPGTVGDKFRHGTSYITIATRGRQRYFDQDAVRDVNGVPPIDYEIDGDLVWPLAASRGINTPVSTAESDHLAMYPEELPRRLIQAMCPASVWYCSTCATQIRMPDVSDPVHGTYEEGASDSSPVLQQSVRRHSPSDTSADVDLPRMPPPVPKASKPRSTARVLQPELFGSVDRKTAARQADDQQGVRGSVDAHAPERPEVGLRHGTQAGDGSTHRTPVDSERSSTSPEPRQAGQQTGEPALDVEVGARPDAHEAEACPHCGNGLEKRAGTVLDPFVGSGTTAAAAQSVGRNCVSIDVDPRNVDLVRERVGMFLNVVES